MNLCKIARATRIVTPVARCLPHNKPMQKIGKIRNVRPRKINVKITKLLLRNFWERVDKGPHPQGCWHWIGNVATNGYGRFSAGSRKKVFSAHRFSYFIHFYDPGVTLLVTHECDNPICVNPKHLTLGLDQKNADDRVKRRRSATGSRHPSRLYPGIYAGELNGRAILTEAEVTYIQKFPRFYGALKILERQFSQVKRVTLEKIRGGHTWDHVK